MSAVDPPPRGGCDARASRPRSPGGTTRSTTAASRVGRVARRRRGFATAVQRRQSRPGAGRSSTSAPGSRAESPYRPPSSPRSSPRSADDRRFRRAQRGIAASWARRSPGPLRRDSIGRYPDLCRPSVRREARRGRSVDPSRRPRGSSRPSVRARSRVTRTMKASTAVVRRAAELRRPRRPRPPQPRPSRWAQVRCPRRQGAAGPPWAFRPTKRLRSSCPCSTGRSPLRRGLSPGRKAPQVVRRGARWPAGAPGRAHRRRHQAPHSKSLVRNAPAEVLRPLNPRGRGGPGRPRQATGWTAARSPAPRSIAVFSPAPHSAANRSPPACRPATRPSRGSEPRLVVSSPASQSRPRARTRRRSTPAGGPPREQPPGGRPREPPLGGRPPRRSSPREPPRSRPVRRVATRVRRRARVPHAGVGSRCRGPRRRGSLRRIRGGRWAARSRIPPVCPRPARRCRGRRPRPRRRLRPGCPVAPRRPPPRVPWPRSRRGGRSTCPRCEQRRRRVGVRWSCDGPRRSSVQAEGRQNVRRRCGRRDRRERVDACGSLLEVACDHGAGRVIPTEPISICETATLVPDPPPAWPGGCSTSLGPRGTGENGCGRPRGWGGGRRSSPGWRRRSAGRTGRAGGRRGLPP